MNKGENMGSGVVKLDAWLKDILVDPLSKEALTVPLEKGEVKTSYGRRYSFDGAILDLRVLNNRTTPDQKLWRDGQLEYELLSEHVAAQDASHDYEAENIPVAAVYKAVPVEGRCLDVGGHQGRLRRYLRPDQEYVSCDPFRHVFDKLDQQPKLLATYPFLKAPVNFLCCDAEFLPFQSQSFDTVHMRSVIDHFLSPEQALCEAYRVLRTGGALIVGLYVHGGKSGRTDAIDHAKELIKDTLTKVGFDRFKDHHVWHPTFAELQALIADNGFDIETVYWQEGSDDSVCYIKARKQVTWSRRAG